uniref:RNA-binding protein FUS n=1 Tax=Zeugodacus cucurbitae TaxID=28588 RepID=A0A0A1X6D9_ZEUCU
MKQLNLVLWLALLLHQEWLTLTSAAQQQQTTSNAQSSVVQLYDSNRGENAAAAPAESVLGSIYRKSRQSRCVRCYEDRYGDDRSRYYGTSGYSSHSADNWYYPYDRYDDRYRSEDRYRTEDRYRPDYDRYSSSSSMASSYYRDRDDRLGSRTYDRYDTRGYDRYDRRGGYEQDRYGDYSRDRYYERPRGGASYDRDYYDRSTSSRYDYRNYRPYDETYSSAYGSRPPRPLGGSYLFDRDSNTVGDEKMADNAADKDTSGGNADGVSNISSSSMTGEQNRDMNNGGANGNDGGMANSMQTNVRDKQ